MTLLKYGTIFFMFFGILGFLVMLVTPLIPIPRATLFIGFGYGICFGTSARVWIKDLKR